MKEYWVFLVFFILMLMAICAGIYSDHIYKMKRLELIEKGKIQCYDFGVK